MIRLNGVDFHVETEGEGPPLLLLHGFTGSTRSWDALITDLTDIAKTVRLDLVGHGLSAAPTEPRRYAIDAAAHDLIALLDALQIATASVLGYSMGGRLALYFAVHYPERVERLILESASPGIEDAAERAQRLTSDAALANRLERKGLEPFIAFWERQPLLEPMPHVTQEARARQSAIRLQHTPHGLANSLRGMGTGSQPSLWSALPHVKVPTLLVTGDRDTRYCDVAARMRSLLPNAEHRVVREAGHTAHVDQPAAFARVVRDYLENSFSPRNVPSGSGRPAAPTDRMHS